MASGRFERRVLTAERTAVAAVMRGIGPGPHKPGSWSERAFDECEQRLRKLDAGEITSRQILRDMFAATGKQVIGEDVTLSDADIEGFSLISQFLILRGIRRGWLEYGQKAVRLDAAGVRVEGRGDAGTRRETVPEGVRPETKPHAGRLGCGTVLGTAGAIGLAIGMVGSHGWGSWQAILSIVGFPAVFAFYFAIGYGLAAWFTRQARTAASTAPAPLSPGRQPISERVRHDVWRRDQGRCVDCASRERLELDHIIPVSRGGSNTARNIELRCEACNRKKGARI